MAVSARNQLTGTVSACLLYTSFIVIKAIFKLKMNFVAVSTCHFDIIDIIHRRDNQHWHNYCL